jgi:hypothetical protein
LCILEIIEHAAAAFVEKLSFLSQPDASRGALKETRAELLFEVRHRLADGRSGKAEHTTGRCEAAEIGRFDKSREPAELVHTVSIRAFYSTISGTNTVLSGH